MRKNLLIAGAVATAALLMVSCGGGSTKKTSQVAEEQQSVYVKVDQATLQSVSEEAIFTASLQAYQQNFVVPAIAARIENIYVEVGDKVKKGQLLVDLDKNQFNQTIVQLENAEANLERMQKVYESGGISQQQIDELNTNIVVLRETVDNLNTNLELRSPIDGIITGRYNEVGDLYSMSPNAAGGVGILQVMQMDKLKAYVGVSEQYFPQVYINMPVEITADVFPGEVFKGHVTRIAPAINSATRTFEVEVTIPNPNMKLRPGMFTRTKFNMGQSEAVTVEDITVQKQAGTNNKYVYVVNNGVAQRRTVTTGRQNGSRLEILSGVSQGEQVVTTGISRLKDGSTVTIVKN